jgi:protein disulfide-isomerase A1
MQVTFDGERTVKGFYQFLKRNAAIPFSLPKPSQSHQNSPAAPVSATIEKTSSGEQLKDEL